MIGPGRLAIIGGAIRILAPQRDGAAGRDAVANPRTLITAGSFWLLIGLTLSYFGFANGSEP